jgi:hypothetical protein
MRNKHCKDQKTKEKNKNKFTLKINLTSNYKLKYFIYTENKIIN